MQEKAASNRRVYNRRGCTSIIALLVILIINSAPSIASYSSMEGFEVKNCGNYGNLFEIYEPSLLDEILTKLEQAKGDGTLESLNKQFTEKVQKKILRPSPVKGISRAKHSKTWSYDPSYKQETDIKDEQGRIIVAAGTTVNPMEFLNWGEPLIFIDGDDKEQVIWAKAKTGRIVLTSGAPIELAKDFGMPIYFDQAGVLCRRFQIEKVPAIIEQKGMLLLVQEIRI